MGLDCISVEIFPVREISPATYITQGKTEQLRELVEDNEIEIVVFDTFLSPRQQRNLEQILSCAVIDREEVILQIFSDHARTREARLQTDLAYALYSLPRLTRAWTHLSRQRGGAKGTRGEGETQLEVDRRLVRARINRIEKELAEVRKQRSVQRKNRLDSSKSLIAVVGYTNAGKSSLLNSLCDSDIHVEDKLFATLEPVTRNIILPSGRSVLISDTVGFVQNLPHHLVESFKSTLEEVAFADVLIHVIDASHPDPLTCYETTRQVLHELNITDTPTINVINKIDAVENQFIYQRMRHELEDVVEISVREHLGYEKLLSRIEAEVFSRSVEMNLLLPYGEGKLLSLLHENAQILSTEYTENGVALHVTVPRSLVDSCISYTQVQP